jgi:heme-degrading monooxygenase HmoA
VITVIVGYKLKTNVDIQPILSKLMSNVITHPGFIKAQNLVSTKDPTIAVVIYTWETIEEWHVWENTSIRKEIIQQADTILLEEPRVTIYHVKPSTGWVHDILDD